MQAFLWHELPHRAGILKYAREAGWILDFVNLASLYRLTKWEGDGMICQIHPNSREMVEAVFSKGVPKVDMAGYVPDLEAPLVLPDYRAAGRMVAKHFLERGFQKFIYVGRSVSGPGLLAMWEMEQGFAQTIGEAGYVVNTLYWDDPGLRESGYSLLADPHAMGDSASAQSRQWLREKISQWPKPTAVFVQYLDFAVDLLDACDDVGALVPEEVSVVSMSGETIDIDLPSIQLSTVIIDYREQGYRAAQLLDNLMDGGMPPKEPILVPPKEIRVLRSSDIFAVANREVARALAFIIQHFHRPTISVEDVVQATEVSRTVLYELFKEYMGCTIATKIDSLRCEKAKCLLAQTTIKIREIAIMCGYSDARHFNRSLKSASGMTPTEYRRRNRIEPKT
jgi:LacI family transcriptional regulator